MNIQLKDSNGLPLYPKNKIENIEGLLDNIESINNKISDIERRIKNEELYYYSQDMALSTSSWTKINYKLPYSGSYIIYIEILGDASYGGGWYTKATGLFSYYDGYTNSSETTNIPLCQAGHAYNSYHLKMRTRLTPNSDGTFVMELSTDYSDWRAARPINFTFKRLI